MPGDLIISCWSVGCHGQLAWSISCLFLLTSCYISHLYSTLIMRPDTSHGPCKHKLNVYLILNSRNAFRTFEQENKVVLANKRFSTRNTHQAQWTHRGSSC